MGAAEVVLVDDNVPKKTIKATIENAGVYKISELFARKPKHLKMTDTDAVVVTAKTPDGKKVTKTFYFCLKPDGTFNVNTVGKDGSSARRRRLAAFLKYYKLAEDVKGYNIKEKVGEWKGKTIEVVPDEKGPIIFIP